MKAGCGHADITPQRPMSSCGFAARYDAPFAKGTESKLLAALNAVICHLAVKLSPISSLKNKRADGPQYVF